MKKKLHRITLLLFMLVLQFSYSQNNKVTVTGTVSDHTGPLPGVVVVVKNTSTGTQTNFDGFFSLEARTGTVLEFSYIGMISVLKTVQNSSPMIITMEEDRQNLDEVVVVAFGVQRKEAIVGAISTIGSDMIENQQAVSVVSALQGNVSGVNIIQAGGQPGNNPVIRIRGIGSINASAEPLIIVDGSPFNGNLNTISSDQIASMTVLKDASSTSLYGSRGSNGVILINTKRGKLSTPTTVNIRSSIGFANQAVDNHQLVDTDTFTEFTWEAMRNSNLYVNDMSAADAAQDATNELVTELGYDPYGNGTPVGTDGKLLTTDKLWDTDWQDYLFNDSAIRTDHSLSVSGGNDNTSYFFSANYLDQEGSIQTSSFERTTTRLSIDSQVNDWLKLGLSSFYSTSSSTVPTQSGTTYTSTIQWINNVSSYYPLYRRDASGSLILDSSGNKIYDYGNNQQSVNGSRPLYSNENIVGSLYNYDILENRDNISLNGYAQINFTQDLSFKTQISYEKYIFDTYEYIHNEYGYASSVGGRVSQNRNFVTTKNIINSLNYLKTFNEVHNISVDLIHEAYERNNDDLGAQGVGYLPDVSVLDGSTTPEAVTGSFTDETLESYLGRVTYNYDSKYFAEASFRTDGSSRFAEDVRWGDFYAVGASWMISKENFFSDIDNINLLKLRASYGELGNNRGIGYFPYLSLYETGYNELDNTGVILGEVADQFLTWEKVVSSNIGVDFGFFNNILKGSIDYYSKESIDLIYDQPLPPSTGNESIKTNVGALKNYGIEVSLGVTIINKKDFIWTTDLNMSFDNNEITELTQESFINGTKRWEVGKSLYEFYIREWAGVDPDTGYGMWYKDILDDNGNPTGKQETTTNYTDATRNYNEQSSLPDFIGGFSNSLTYKDFDFNLLLNFSVGSYIYDSNYAALMGGFDRPGETASSDISTRWQNPGDVTDIPLLLASQNDFNSTSDRFLFKNNYLRLKALTIGYSIPTTAIEKYGINNLRLFFQGDNLLTFQSHKGIDPEQSVSGITNYRSYNQRIISMGLNIKF
ncbi:TonB-dependent receptor [Flavicella sp.]|uniref:SusC/RagA family TonB-linked outer membrane protein n=1 Tax=Flavicella sp. TaxID=2957742 RepID=UPI003016AB9D